MKKIIKEEDYMGNDYENILGGIENSFCKLTAFQVGRKTMNFSLTGFLVLHRGYFEITNHNDDKPFFTMEESAVKSIEENTDLSGNVTITVTITPKDGGVIKIKTLD